METTLNVVDSENRRKNRHSSDQRVHFRVLHSGSATIISNVSDSGTNLNHVASIIDLGLGGARIKMDGLLQLNKPVFLNIDLGKFGVIERVQGYLTWSTAGNERMTENIPLQSGKVEYGIRFECPETAQIQTILKFLDDSVSSRHTRKLTTNRRRLKYFQTFLSKAKEKGIFYKPHITQTAPAPIVAIENKEVIQLCSNNSLGLSLHPRVIKSAKEALEKFGTGCGGSRLLSGNLILQTRLEKRLAEFFNYPDTILFMTGYMANVGMIEALTNIHDPSRIVHKEDVVGLFIDHENHRSIMHGCQLAGLRNNAVLRTYTHLDLAQLEEQLKTTHTSRKIIITEGVFSMRGDIAPLPDIVQLAKKYKALIYLDDAHAIGHLGKTGRGSIEHWGLSSNDVDIIIGTFSKAFGAAGGFAVASNEICEYMRLQANTYIFSSALPPATVGGILEAISVIDSEPEIRQRFWENASYFRNAVQSIGLNTLGSRTHITPVLIGSDEKAIRIAAGLFVKNIYVPAVRWPAVDPGKAILRCMVMAQHSKNQIDFVVKELERLAAREGII